MSTNTIQQAGQFQTKITLKEATEISLVTGKAVKYVAPNVQIGVVSITAHIFSLEHDGVKIEIEITDSVAETIRDMFDYHFKFSPK